VNPTSVTVSVRCSKPMPDGSHKTVELSLDASLTSGESWKEVQTSIYKELGEQMRYVWSTNGNSKPTQEQPKPETLAPLREHWCEAHRAEFKRCNGPHGEFYSHKASDGSWCNEG
jgi:hypothetical protein